MRFIGLLFLILWFGGCASPRPIHHVVLVWYIPDLSDEEKTAIMQASRTLADIDGVESLHLGNSINKYPDRFDLGLTFEFESALAMEEYLSSPDHVNFVKLHIRDKVKKVLIYDY